MRAGGGSVDPESSSSLPETDLARIDRWIRQENEKIPPDVRDKVRVEADVDQRSVTVVECRPPWDPARMGSEWTREPVARLRYTRSRRQWTLFWLDQHSKFHVYDLVPPTSDVKRLLDEIHEDPISIFWG